MNRGTDTKDNPKSMMDALPAESIKILSYGGSQENQFSSQYKIECESTYALDIAMNNVRFLEKVHGIYNLIYL